jgi:hypothetical protein
MKNRGFLALEAPLKRRSKNITICSIYKQKSVCCQVRDALDRIRYDQSHVTTSEFPWRKCEAIAARVTRDMRLTRHALDRGSCVRSHQVRSSALAGAMIYSLLNSTPLNHILTKDLQHTKTLNQHKNVRY